MKRKNSELLGWISGALAFDDQDTKGLAGVLLLLRSRSKPSAKREGAVVLALDARVGRPEITAIDRGARGDALTGEVLCEVVPDEALESTALGLLRVGHQMAGGLMVQKPWPRFCMAWPMVMSVSWMRLICALASVL